MGVRSNQNDEVPIVYVQRFNPKTASDDRTKVRLLKVGNATNAGNYVIHVRISYSTKGFAGVNQWDNTTNPQAGSQLVLDQPLTRLERSYGDSLTDNFRSGLGSRLNLHWPHSSHEFRRQIVDAHHLHCEKSLQLIARSDASQRSERATGLVAWSGAHRLT